MRIVNAVRSVPHTVAAASVGGIREGVATLDTARRLALRHTPIPHGSRSAQDTAPGVLLVHGLGANKSCWGRLAGRLHARGFRVETVDYRSWGGDVNSAAARVARALDSVAQTSGGPVHVVGHSLGGFVTRVALERFAYPGGVGTVVSLGSPHRGAPGALVPFAATVPGYGTLISSLHPHSDELTVQHQPLPAGVRWFTVSGGMDVLVPHRYAQLPGNDPAAHRHFPGIGHVALVTDQHVSEHVVTTLAPA